MIKKNGYETPNMEIIPYSAEDIVCTSKPDDVKNEVGGPWSDVWGK